MSNGNRNAANLLKIILGSAEVQQAFKNDEKKKAAFLKKFVQNLREKVRDQIDANLPFMYLVDANVIVSSMLNILNPINTITEVSDLDEDIDNPNVQYTSPFALYELKKTKTEDVYRGVELFKYFKSVSYKDANGAITVYTQQATLDKNLPTAYAAAYNKLAAKQQNIVSEIVSGLSNQISSKVTVTDIKTIIDKSLTKSADYQLVGTTLRTEFNTIGVSVVTDPGTLLSNYSPQSQVLVIGQSFDSVTGRVNDVVTEILEKALENTGLVPVTKVERGRKGFKAGNFAAAGHSGISTRTKLIGINTPLLQMVTLILSLRGRGIPTIYDDFVLQTLHNKNLIGINQNYETFGDALLSVGIAVGQSQDTVYNSKKLGGQETRFINKELENYLTASYRTLKKELEEALEQVSRKSEVIKVLTDTFRMSPTLKEHIVLTVKNIFDGKDAYKGPKGRAKGENAPKATTKSRVDSSKFSKNKATGKKSSLANVPLAKVSIKPVRSTVNLSMLMLQINSSLHDQIKRNMGTGNRKDVLNYRTGRFAQSAKVEQMSESRQGMITAFYSYMKNPYATFSRGGRQDRPYTRDPKTLISKSIRELAGQQVANRMRAVLI